MKTLLILWALSGPLSLQQAILQLSGVSCIEELAEDEMQRYESLAAHPVDLNLAGRSRLLSTGLLTPFQVASLLDYRERSGAILSWTELGLVDGFLPERVQALQHFFVLGSPETAPGQRPDRRFRQTLTAKATVRTDGEAAGGLKYEAAFGERAVLYGTLRNQYGRSWPPQGTVSAAIYGRRVLGQLIVGHFNARFGQGLVQWSGFQLSGYDQPGALRKNGTGLSPTSSYSPSLMGVAADWHFGAWRLSTAYSWLGNRPILNLCRTGRTLSASLTATGDAASLECRASLPGWSLFGEAACSWQGQWTGVAGTVWTPAYGHKAGLLGRWLGTGKQYSGIAVGYEGPTTVVMLDAAWRPDSGAGQYKLLAQWKPVFERASLKISPQARLQARWRPPESAPLCLELRGTLTLEYGRWTAAGRYDAVFCRGFAWQWYAEAGWKDETLSLYLRGGLFKVDNWDDRIYVYERDAPGNFTVPARYGRGWDASCYAAWHINRHHSLWLRASAVYYPWNLTEKEGRTEVRLQYRYRK